MSALAPNPARAAVRREHLRRASQVCVSGVLVMDAVLALTNGEQPHQLMVLHFEPAEGLPYAATLDLGTDLADAARHDALMPELRRGAAVCVGGRALALRHFHGQDHLTVVKPSYVVILAD